MDQPRLDNLPDDVLLEVFSWLPPSEMAKCALHVCDRWRKLFRFRTLWHRKPPYEATDEDKAEEAYQVAQIASSGRTLILECGYDFHLKATEDTVTVRWDVFQQEKFELLTAGAHIENLHIPGNFLVWSNVTSLARCLPQLKSLTVNNGVTDWPSAELPDAMARLLGTGLLRELRSLSVRGGSSQSVELDEVLLAVFRGCPQLEDLRLEWTDQITQRGLAVFAASTCLRQLHVSSVRSPLNLNFLPASLQVLEVSCCPGVELSRFGSDCDGCPQLRTMTLKSCAIMGAQLAEVAPRLTPLDKVNLSGNRTLGDLSFLRSWPNLQSLNLGNCSRFYSASFGALGFLKNLKSLNICRCDLQNVSVDVIGSLAQLEELFLAGTTICQGQSFAASLPASLRLLDISWCLWVDAAVILELRHLRQLRTLLLSQCGGVTGWQHLAAVVLPRLSALESLDVSGVGATSGESLRDLSFLRFCPQLLELDVGVNGGIPPAAFFDLRYVPTLRRLNLRGSDLHNVPFCETLGQLSHLETLTIYGCRGINETKLNDLCHHLPKLKIEGWIHQR